MTALPEVVTLLADVDFLTKISKIGGLPNKPIGEFIRESKHLDGRPISEAEAELIGSATPEDLRAVQRYLDTNAELARDRERDVDRFVAIVEPAFDKLPPDSVMDDALASLPPADRAEALELADRLFPDGYVYPHGGGPRL